MKLKNTHGFSLLTSKNVLIVVHEYCSEILKFLIIIVDTHH